MLLERVPTRTGSLDGIADGYGKSALAEISVMDLR